MADALDYHGYPTDKTLKSIRKAEFNAVLDVVKEAWHPVYGAQRETLSDEEAAIVMRALDREETRYLRLATGGWSGNEDILEAFHRNWAWHMHWRLSASGGMHIFAYVPLDEDEADAEVPEPTRT